jgi:predicted helicase
MSATFQDLLNELTQASRTNRDKGTQFERLIANYLVTDPQYADRLADVWLWSEWPDRSGADVGIDLVARERGTGDYWAIQCKFFDPATQFKNLTSTRSFLLLASSFATKDGSKHCFATHCCFHHRQMEQERRECIEGQTIPVSRIWFKDLG